MQRPSLREHQEYALRKMHNGAILWGPVGSGKSRVAMSYYLDKEAPKPLYVITTAKKRDSLDWDTEAALWAVGTASWATTAGVLHVDSWNNMHRYEDVIDAFFIFDEQRLVGSGDWVRSFLKIVKHNNWIMLSATPGDTWLDYIPVFVANGFYKNRTAFKREHVVYNSYTKYPKVDRYVGVQKLVRLRSKILVKMPFNAHTIRNEYLCEMPYDENMMTDVVERRWHVFEDRPINSLSEWFYLMRRVANDTGVYGLDGRMAKLTEIQAKRKRVIVFYSFDYEIETLREMGGLVPFGEYNGHKHEDIPNSSEWVYAVQYSAGSESWDCIETDTIVFWSLTYSYKQWEQAHGRIDRMNSPYLHLYYYVLKSAANIDKSIWKALTNKRDFQTSDFTAKPPRFTSKTAKTV
jgi:hypothetical protein